MRVVALCAGDVPADAPWRRWLRHRCAAALALSPVEGRTAVLDGELSVEYRAAPARSSLTTTEAAGGWGGGLGSGGGGNGNVGRCFFRASELSVRWLRDVQSADLLR